MTTTTATDAARVAVLAAARAVQQASGAPAALQRPHPRHGEPAGTMLARLVICASRSREEKRGLAQFAAGMFPHDPEVIAIARTATGVADTTTAGWAAQLVRTETRALFAELQPLSAWASLASLGLAAAFAGAASVVVPQLNVGNAVDGGWVAEGGAIPVVKGSVSTKRLLRYKLAGIVPITMELQRTSDPDAVETMRQLLRNFLANLLDSSMLDSAAAVPGVRPAGLLFGVTPTAGATGGGVAALTADLKTLVAAFVAGGFDPRRMALVVNPVQWAALATMVDGQGRFAVDMGSGQVQTFPVITSAFQPAGEVTAVATSHFATASDAIELDESEDGTLVMANADGTAPTHAGDAPLGGGLGTPQQVVPDGGIPVAGGSGASIAGITAMSLWQTWSLGVRLVMPASFGTTKAGAVQALTGVTW